MLVSEVSSVEEWKERQIKSGRWQSMTPEQQSSSIRHQKEDYISWWCSANGCDHRRRAAGPRRRVADLIRAGKVRVGLFPPQYTKDPVTGELRSVWVEI